MNRTLARAMACALAVIVSFATVPLGRAQAPASSAPSQAPTAGPTETQPAGQAQGNPQASPQETNPSNHQPPVELPENPGRNNAPAPAANAPAPAQPQEQKPEPNGTAVAPQIQTSGGAASKPAGVALAPPKQRRTRSLLIKLGVLAGAGIAIGTVAGLSAASPSHVPNSPGH
jgi:hypothetical protein